MARGHAEPPIATLRIEVSVLPSRSRYWSSIIQTVGTAAENVTRSPSSSSYTEAPSSLAPGITILQPIIGHR